MTCDWMPVIEKSCQMHWVHKCNEPERERTHNHIIYVCIYIQCNCVNIL